jgi:hypothetical protein
MFFSAQIILNNTDLYSNIEKQTGLCLGTFEYIETDREIYRKLIKKIQTIFHNTSCFSF